MFTLSTSTGALTAVVPGPTRARKGPAALVVSSGTKDITYTPSFVYVADLAGGVPTLSVNDSTGALTSVSGSPFGSGDPRAVAVTPNGQFLYTATGDGSNTIGEYSVDTETGALTSIGTIANGDSPYDVAVDPSGRFVYAVAIDTNSVYGYKINSTTGVLTSISGSPFTTDVVAPDSVAVDPTGRFLMVGNYCCTGGVSVYSINTSNGKLTAVKGSPFPPPSGGADPASVTVDPTGRYVYAASSSGGGTTGVVAYSITASSGKLTAIGTVLPGGGNPWSITTDVLGKYVYMTDNDTTLYGYTINNTTGELTALAGSPFTADVSTRGIAADPSGAYLYLSNAEQLLGYSINATTGAITQLSSSPYTAGSDPLGVCVAGTIQ
jgi:6-phosphogluconolactonase (cycloisomerase 2 family)